METKSEKDLIEFLNELNTKHTSIKFEFKYSRQQTEFLDTLVHIDNNHKLQTTLCKKPTDRQNYLHSKSEHPYSIKKSIAYSQALRIKRICSTQNEFEKHSSNLLQQLKKKGYHHDTLIEQIQKARVQERTLLLNENPQEVKQSIPISAAYNRTLPKIKSIVNKHWHVLQVNSELKERFQSSPIIAFRKNKNLKQIIGSNTIKHNKKLIRSSNNVNGKSSHFVSNTRTLCYKQVVSTTSFKSNQTNRVFKIFHNINCKSTFLIYLHECNICNIQYVGKIETTLNIPLNNHRKDVKDQNALPVDKHFTLPGHHFNKNAKFTLIEKLTNRNKVANETLKEKLKNRENFWIIKLRTLTPNGLNQGLN